MPAERSFAMQRLDELDRALGKGESLSRAEQKLVLTRGVPAWLFVMAKTAKGSIAEEAADLADRLAKLHARGQAALPEVLRTKSD